MKHIRHFLLGIGILLAILLTLGICAPKEYTTKQTIDIESRQNEVFDQLSALDRMNQWYTLDTMNEPIIPRYIGLDGTIGSKCIWSGHPQKGNGSQVIREKVPFKLMKIRERRNKPWNQVNMHIFELNREGNSNKTTVKWTVQGKSPFPFNIMLLFRSPLDQINKEMIKSISALKTLSEAEERRIKIASFDAISKPIEESTYYVVKSFKHGLRPGKKTIEKAMSAIYPDSTQTFDPTYYLLYDYVDPLGVQHPLLLLSKENYGEARFDQLIVPKSKSIIIPFSGKIMELNTVRSEAESYFRDQTYQLSSMVLEKLTFDDKQTLDVIAEVRYNRTRS